jgi:predicted SnoaL-like aldol condensation-catalyzing enzyme
MMDVSSRWRDFPKDAGRSSAAPLQSPFSLRLNPTPVENHLGNKRYIPNLGKNWDKSIRETMSIESNKALVRRVFEEIYNLGHYDVADELIALDYLSHNGASSEILGAEGVKQSARQQRATFPDLHSFVTHINEFMGYPPTGCTFEVTWMQIVRIEGGKLTESWWEMDMEQFRKHLRGKE